MRASLPLAVSVIERPHFDCCYLRPDAYLARAAAEQAYTLAAIVHGAFDPPDLPWPLLPSQYSLCDGSQAMVEVWSCASPMQRTQEGDFVIALSDDYLFFSTAFQPRPGAEFETQIEQCYLALFQQLDRLGYGHLLRIWNILPDINADWDGLEQYRRFCRGRYEAFAAARPDLTALYPAASALGARGTDFTLYGLAARRPGLPVENPNQVSAFRYPQQYGPRSPSFSRALVERKEQAATLFLSGTASVAGHETRHLAQPVAQTEETLHNLRTLIAHAEAQSGCSFHLDAETALLKAFVRRREDFAASRALIEGELGPNVPVLFVDADICRSDLLFEIEGIVFGTATPGAA